MPASWRDVERKVDPGKLPECWYFREMETKTMKAWHHGKMEPQTNCIAVETFQKRLNNNQPGG